MPSVSRRKPTKGEGRWSERRVRGYLELLRRHNVVTAVADVLAGYAVGPCEQPGTVVAADANRLLYAGGVVLNDFFDRELDAVERPERPIPSGRVPAKQAAAPGTALLAGGVVPRPKGPRQRGPCGRHCVARRALRRSREAACARGDGQHGTLPRPNLCFGVAAVPAALAGNWPIALISVVYIAAVTNRQPWRSPWGKGRRGGIRSDIVGGVLAALTAIGLDAGSSDRSLRSY